MALLLIRHGETTWNRDGRYQGHSDPHLSARGEAQAQALAEHFATTQVDSIVTSPSLRAQATAQKIATRLGLPMTTDNRLMELAYGGWEGLQQAEIKQRWPEMLRLWKRAPEQVTFPGGESLSNFQQRVRSFFDQMIKSSGTWLVVTHHGVVRIVVLDARGESLSAFRHIHIDTASITTCDWRDGQWVAADISDVVHLHDIEKVVM